MMKMTTTKKKMIKKNERSELNSFRQGKKTGNNLSSTVATSPRNGDTFLSTRSETTIVDNFQQARTHDQVDDVR